MRRRRRVDADRAACDAGRGELLLEDDRYSSSRCSIPRVANENPFERAP